MSAIAPDKFTPAPRTSLMDGVFEQILRAFKDGATGFDALTLLLQLLNSQFDRVGKGGGIHEVAIFGCV